MSFDIVAAGFLGFACFEGLRLYKRTSAGQPAVPRERLIEHIVVVALSAALVGLVTGLIASDPRNALWLGFSAPTSAAVLFGRQPLVVEDGATPILEGLGDRSRRWLDFHYGLI